MMRLLLCLASAASAAQLDLANWMGQLGPILGDATLLDLSLPGSHDTMTYDLSDALSDGYEGMPAIESHILHSLTPVVAGSFIRKFGQTQGITITDQLDGGLRFFDFRIMYTTAPHRMGGAKDWYCLHGWETNRKAIEYLKEVRTWLDAHPSEIVVIWASRHGSVSATGKDQYPGTTPGQRQAFFGKVEATFGDLLADSVRLNETTVSQLQKTNQRLLWFASDYAEATNSSNRALDARDIDNQLKGSGQGIPFVQYMKKGATKLRDDRAQGKFLLVGMASGCSNSAIEDAAKVAFLPNLFGTHKKWSKACAKSSEIPNMTSWCPSTLMDWSLIGNYYNQRALDYIYDLGSADPEADFPNAIYINAVDKGGLIRTGTAKINPLDMDQSKTTSATSHQEDGYAFSATLIAANVRRLCRMNKSESCQQLASLASAARSQNPVSLWDDEEHGRHANWPSLPTAVAFV